MKNIYLTALLFILLISCNNQEYEYEDRLYNCVIEDNKEIENTVGKLERIYIQNKILDNSNGKSYVKCIHKTFKYESISLLTSDELKKELEPFENIPDRLTCFDTTIMFDTIAAKNSRLSVMANAFDEVLSAGTLIEPIEFIVFKNLTEDDFNHKFYKSTFLLFLTKYILNPQFFNKTGIQRKLPPIKESNEIKERNIMTVYVNEENNIFINDSLIKNEEINDKVKTFFLNPNNDFKLPEKKEAELPKIGKIKVSEGLISLQTERHADYKEYLSVQNELVRAINELRDDFAIKHFNKKFEELPEEDKRIVGNAIPLAISEAEPRRIDNK